MRRVGIGAEKPGKKADAKLKSELKELMAENKQLKSELEKLKAGSGQPEAAGGK